MDEWMNEWTDEGMSGRMDGKEVKDSVWVLSFHSFLDPHQACLDFDTWTD